MKVLAANFIILYQRRSMWAIFVIMALFLFSQIVPGVSYSGNPLMIYVTVIFWFGCAVGSVAGDLWALPLSCCLPGITQTSRRMLLIIVSATVALWSFLTAINFSSTFIQTPQDLIALTGIYAMVLIFGISTSARSRLAGHMMSMMLPVAVLVFAMSGTENVVHAALLSHPYVTTAACIVSSCLMHRPLGKREFIRKHYGVPRTGYLDVWSVSALKKSAKYKETRRGKKSTARPVPLIDNFFTRRMAGTSPVPYASNTWGRIYLILTFLLERSRLSLPIILLISFLLLSYLKETDSFSMMFFGAVSIGHGTFYSIDRSNILLPRGRKERLFGDVVSLTTLLACVLILLTGFVFLSNGLSSVAPPLALFGKTYRSAPLNAEYLYIPLILLPAMVAWQTFFKKHERLSTTVPLLGGIFLISSLQGKIPGFISTVDCWKIIYAVVASGCIFLAVLYYDNMKRSLC